MWEGCGVVRDAAGLEGLARSGHLVARLTAQAALAREESRGAHFRVDFPAEDVAFEGHVVVRDGSRPTLETWL